MNIDYFFNVLQKIRLVELHKIESKAIVSKSNYTIPTWILCLACLQRVG